MNRRNVQRHDPLSDHGTISFDWGSRVNQPLDEVLGFFAILVQLSFQSLFNEPPEELIAVPSMLHDWKELRQDSGVDVSIVKPRTLEGWREVERTV